MLHIARWQGDPAPENQWRPARRGVGGSDKDYWNTGGNPKGNCNWLGPCCHWQTTGSGHVTCCAWTGGGNSYQPQGFPYYYESKFLEYATGKTPPKCPGDCDQLEEQAYDLAKKICDSV